MEKRTNIIRTEGQLPAHLTVALTVAKSSSAPIMAVIADTSRLLLIERATAKAFQWTVAASLGAK